MSIIPFQHLFFSAYTSYWYISPHFSSPIYISVNTKRFSRNTTGRIKLQIRNLYEYLISNMIPFKKSIICLLYNWFIHHENIFNVVWQSTYKFQRQIILHRVCRVIQSWTYLVKWNPKTTLFKCLRTNFTCRRLTYSNFHLEIKVNLYCWWKTSCVLNVADLHWSLTSAPGMREMVTPAPRQTTFPSECQTLLFRHFEG